MAAALGQWLVEGPTDRHGQTDRASEQQREVGQGVGLAGEGREVDRGMGNRQWDEENGGSGAGSGGRKNTGEGPGRGAEGQSKKRVEGKGTVGAGRKRVVSIRTEGQREEKGRKEDRGTDRHRQGE